MHTSLKRHAVAVALVLPIVLLSATDAEAQGRGRGRGRGSRPVPTTTTPAVTAEITISLGDRARIRAFYESEPRRDVQALPPGIRRNLERSKALPPGIAKRSPPQGLRSTITVPERFEIIEVGLDVLLVEVATGVIHDVLMDIIR